MGKKKVSPKKKRGRPPAIPGGYSAFQIAVRLGSNLVKRIDDVRGDASRSEFVRQVLIEGLERREKASRGQKGGT